MRRLGLAGTWRRRDVNQPRGGEGCSGCREQHVPRTGGRRPYTRLELKDHWSWREVSSQSEGAQGGQERLEGEDEGSGQDWLDAWADLKSVEAAED